MFKYIYIKNLHIASIFDRFHSFVFLIIPVTMLRGTDLALWSNLSGMESVEHFMRSQLYITSVSGTR